MRRWVFAVVSLFVLGSCPLAQATTVWNGDFEDHSYSGSYREFLTQGSPGLNHWSIDSGDVDLYYNPSLATPPTPPLNGSWSWLDMNGDQAGAISQDLATIPGMDYVVTFDLGGNPDRSYDPAIKTLRVSAAGQFADFDRDTQHIDWNWASESWTFTAIDSLTTLSFASLNRSGRAGPALDNVAVAPMESVIPEPLSATAMLCSLVGVGTYVRGRMRRG